MIRLATYNVHRSVGRDGKADPRRVVDVIDQIRPDILALQEVAYRPAERGHLLEVLEETLGVRVVEGMTLEDQRGRYGNAIVSRVPIREARHLDISVPRREPRGAIEVQLESSGASLHVIATHLGLRPMERRHQIRAVLRAFQASEASTKVLLGDLNEWFLLGRPIRWIRRVFGDTQAPPTFPSNWPLVALDRCWVSPNTSLRRQWVHDSKLARVASDHLPLVAEIEPTDLDSPAA